MGMGTILEGVRMVPPGLGFPDLIDGVCIPRRRRSCSAEKKEEETKPRVGHEASISMFEAATILIAMAYSIADVDGFCKDELEKKSRKRKKAPSNKPETTPLAKKPRKKKRKEIELPTTPEMPAAMRDRIAEIGGYQIQLVIQKQLQDTDLNKNHGRLSLPPKKLRIDFATEEESKLLNQHDNKNKKGMNVPIIDHHLRESSICLKKWKIGSRHVYCLMTQWNSFVEETALKSGDFIQLWCFRKDDFDAETETIASRLCFAMVKLDIRSGCA